MNATEKRPLKFEGKPAFPYLHLWNVSLLLSVLRQNKHLHSTCRSVRGISEFTRRRADDIVAA